MPRKPTLKKQKITVLVKGTPITVTLHPPTGDRKSWYAMWKGLQTSKSTGHADYDEAVKAVNDMLCHGGKRSDLSDTVLTDDEFEELQRRHYSKKKGDDSERRSATSLRSCLEAISAFKEITGVERIALATPDDCERFQTEALKKRRNWRTQHPKSSEDAKCLSPNTVVKWTTALKAAFERANRNSGKKCVRGVVPPEKLLKENPWHQFTSIEGERKQIRHFTPEELLSLLDHFEANWKGLSFATCYIKLMLWSWARRSEISRLRWSDLRQINSEYHFESLGKWGVVKWFRIPATLWRELNELKGKSEYVFGCYGDQLKRFHQGNKNMRGLVQVRSDFDPDNVGEWMYRQVSAWSKDLPGGSAYLHIFRKTGLQHALNGELIRQSVAKSAHITPTVMQASYVKPEDMPLHLGSNETFERIRLSLPVEVAERYGCIETPEEKLSKQLDFAYRQRDWKAVQELADKLEKLAPPPETVPA